LNPRCTCAHNTLAVCPIRPLWHASQGHPAVTTGRKPYRAGAVTGKTAGQRHSGTIARKISGTPSRRLRLLPAQRREGAAATLSIGRETAGKNF